MKFLTFVSQQYLAFNTTELLIPVQIKWLTSFVELRRKLFSFFVTIL